MDDYSETLLDHYNHPRHTGALRKPDVRIVQHNPLCGDSICLDIAVTPKMKIRDVAFTGSGCALSQAGMSLLSEYVIGKSCTALKRISSDDMDMLVGTRVSPGRRTCADLGLAALKRALTDIENKMKK